MYILIKIFEKWMGKRCYGVAPIYSLKMRRWAYQDTDETSADQKMRQGGWEMNATSAGWKEDWLKWF